MNVFELQQTADEVSSLMKVLSNRNRLLLLCQLVEGEKSVGELAILLGLREQAVSQQLGLLRRDGLVGNRRDGQSIYYKLDRPDVLKLMEFLYNTYCGPDGSSDERAEK